MIFNKNFSALTVISVLLGSMFILALQKTIPVTIQNVVNYCEEFTHSVGMTLPHNLELLMFMVVVVIVLLAIVKAVLILSAIRRLRNRLTSKEITSPRLKRLIDSLGLKDQVVLVEDYKQFAFCLGLRNAKIYLSTGLVDILNFGELEVVLRHEKHHLVSNDSLANLFTTLIQSLFPFFPLLSDIAKNYRHDLELKADQAALKSGRQTDSMVAVLKKLLSSGIEVPAFVAALGPVDSLEDRIKILTGVKPNIRKFGPLNIFISLVSIIFLLTIVIVPVQAVEIHDQDEDLITFCITRPSPLVPNSSVPASRITP